MHGFRGVKPPETLVLNWKVILAPNSPDDEATVEPPNAILKYSFIHLAMC